MLAVRRTANLAAVSAGFDTWTIPFLLILLKRAVRRGRWICGWIWSEAVLSPKAASICPTPWWGGMMPVT